MGMESSWINSIQFFSHYDMGINLKNSDLRLLIKTIRLFQFAIYPLMLWLNSSHINQMEATNSFGLMVLTLKVYKD